MSDQAQGSTYEELYPGYEKWLAEQRRQRLRRGEWERLVAEVGTADVALEDFYQSEMEKEGE